MAITTIEYTVLKSLKRRGLIPEEPAILELGQNNWYGDVPLEKLFRDIEGSSLDPEPRAALMRRLSELMDADAASGALFDLAEIFFRALLCPREMAAVDLNGTDRAKRHDLNEPLDLGRAFDLVIDFGTAEHVFDVRSFFTTVHAHTRRGGIMIHGQPVTGWIDHGFYTFQSTLWWDMAAANNYRVETMILAELSPLKIREIESREHFLQLAAANSLGQNAMLFPIFRKLGQGIFIPPMQGIYSETLSDEATQAWMKLR